MPPTAISVGDAVDRALERTRDVLFRPFQLSKWFILGFCAFLTTLGRGGCSFQYRFSAGGDAGPPIGDAVQWITSHLLLVIALSGGALVIGLAVRALLDWLSSRGQFMLLDGVVRDRGAVSEPWHCLAGPANSYFVLRYTITVGIALLSVGILAACVVLAWPSLMAETFDSRAQLALIVGRQRSCRCGSFIS